MLWIEEVMILNLTFAFYWLYLASLDLNLPVHTMEVVVPVKNFEEAYVLPYFQAKLSCHSFMNVDKRHETPQRRKTVYFSQHCISWSISICLDSPSLSSHKAVHREPGNTGRCSRLGYSSGSFNVRNSNLLY